MTRLYELLARVSADGSVAWAARDLTTVNGKDYEGDPRPVTAADAEIVGFAAEFNAAAVAASAGKAKLVQDLADMTASAAAKDLTIAEKVQTIADRDQIIVTMTADHAAALLAQSDAAAAALHTQAESLAASAASARQMLIDAHAAEVAALRATINDLRNPPVNPRIYEPRPFSNAFFTQEQQIEIFSSTAPLVVYARGQLTLAKFVDLDDPDTASLLGVLALAGIITAERIQEILNTGKTS